MATCEVRDGMVICEVKNLCKQFGGLKAVNDVSFSLEKGQILGIIGPNGAGKSTLFNLVTSCLKPNSGEVFLNGENLIGMESHRIILKGLGRTFQEASLFPNSTVLQNVLNAKFGRIAESFSKTLLKSYLRPRILRDQKNSAMEIINFVGLGDCIDSLACNLDHGRQGMLQLAIAMATDPQILMVDEPLRGMNPTEKDEVTDLLLKIRDAGVSIVIIEHDIKSIMKICDHIVVINYGQKIAEGDPDTIKNDEKVIEAYLGSDSDA